MGTPIASAPSCPHGKLWDQVATPQGAKAHHSEGWPGLTGAGVYRWPAVCPWVAQLSTLNSGFCIFEGKNWLKRNCQRISWDSWDCVVMPWRLIGIRTGGVQLGKASHIPLFPHSTSTLIRFIFWYHIDAAGKKRLLQLTENLKSVYSDGLSSLGPPLPTLPLLKERKII